MSENLELRVLFSDWDGEARCWKLPRVSGMVVTGVCHKAGLLPPADYALRTKRNQILVLWKPQTPPPSEPAAIVKFKSDTRFRWFRDPRFLTPVLALAGVLAGVVLQFYGQVVTSNAKSIEQKMAALAQQSISLSCNNSSQGLAAIQACLQNYEKLKADYNDARRKYQDEVETNKQLWDEKNASAQEPGAARRPHQKNAAGVSAEGKPK